MSKSDSQEYSQTSPSVFTRGTLSRWLIGTMWLLLLFLLYYCLQRISAAQIRSVTNQALDLLASDETPATTNSELIDPVITPSLSLDEEVELRLSYAEYERLYTNGIVSRQQIQGGKCKRRDFIRIREFLQEHMTQTERDAFDRDYNIVLGMRNHVCWKQ